MKHYKSFAWMMAIAIAGMTMTACSLDSNEPEKPFTTCPESETMLYACGVNESGTRSIGDAQDVLFTENDIEWFNITTREIKFKDMEEPLYKRLVPFHEIKFYLGDNDLFIVSSFVDHAEFDGSLSLLICFIGRCNCLHVISNNNNCGNTEDNN